MKRSNLTLVGLAVFSFFGTCLNSEGGTDKDPEEARRSLQKEGFKTGLVDFNFFTDAATATRAAALTNAIRTRPPMLLEPCGTESAIIAWKGANFTTKKKATRAFHQLMRSYPQIGRTSTQHVSQHWQVLFVLH